jgi:hypothetical protein
VHLAQLQHVPPGEGPQERPQRGRRPDTAEQHRQRPVPQHVQIIDAVRTRGHPGHQARHLHLRVHPAPPAHPDMLRHQATQPRPLRQRHYRHQPSPRHQIRVIKRCVRLRQLMQQSHLRGVLSTRDLEAQQLPSSQFRGHLSRRRARTEPHLRGGSRLRQLPPMRAAGSATETCYARSGASEPRICDPSRSAVLRACRRPGSATSRDHVAASDHLVRQVPSPCASVRRQWG